MIQTLLLTAWSVAFVTPLLWAGGKNVCTLTFAEGATRFWSGISPYLPPTVGDVFHYSPFFAMAYGAFEILPDRLEVFAFALLNAFVFWAGVSAWFRIRRSMSPWMWVALAGCAMELDISLRYQQTNALLAGLMLLGLAAYRDGKVARAGAFLALAVNLKVIPGVFALALVFPPRRRYVLALLATLALTIVLPGVVGGFGLHAEQWRTIGADISQRHLLDLKSALERAGLPGMGELARIFVMAGAAVVFPLAWLTRPREGFSWGPWYTLGVATPLLLIPRVESPTFVWIAPAYLFLMERLGGSRRALLALVVFSITFVYTSLWPQSWWPEMRTFWASKSFGTLILWALAVNVLVRAYVHLRMSPLARRVNGMGGIHQAPLEEH